MTKRLASELVKMQPKQAVEINMNGKIQILVIEKVVSGSYVKWNTKDERVTDKTIDLFSWLAVMSPNIDYAGTGDD